MTEVLQNANCIECDSQLSISSETLIGEIIRCSDCGAELEVVATNPLNLELAPEVEEDWGE